MQTLEKLLEKRSVSDDRAKSVSAITMASLVGEVARTLVLFPVIRLYTRPQVYRNELSEAGPYIFAANHCSHLDAPLVLAALPRTLRLRLRVAAAADYFFDRPWKATVMKCLLNAFPFVRKGPHCTDSLEQAEQLLAEGYSILLFPEGTRSKDGCIQPFKRGVARLALSGLAPVVPVGIEGAHAAMPKGARWPRRQQVVVRFGAPLTFSSGNDSPDSVTEVVSEIEQQVRALVPDNGAL